MEFLFLETVPEEEAKRMEVLVKDGQDVKKYLGYCWLPEPLA